VDDDCRVSALLHQYLEAHGLRVDIAPTIQAMWCRLEAHRPAVILLADGLPDGNGLAEVPRLRQHDGVGIIMLTMDAAPDRRCLGLDLGADDYIAKPFHLAEVRSRLHAVLRRVGHLRPEETPPHSFGGWTLDDLQGCLVGPAGKRVTLTDKELRLWRELAQSPGEPIDRDRLSCRIRSLPWEPDNRAIDVLISRLRARIERMPRLPEIIVTVRTKGYMLVPDGR
ncbi:MAG: DNA-binding response regulator, partial [Rhodospirillales bacterium]